MLGRQEKAVMLVSMVDLGWWVGHTQHGGYGGLRDALVVFVQEGMYAVRLRHVGYTLSDIRKLEERRGLCNSKDRDRP